MLPMGDGYSEAEITELDPYFETEDKRLVCPRASERRGSQR